MRNIQKDFFGNQVLTDINLTLREGEVLGLVGENGAGKSTLMKILFGMDVIRETGGYGGDVLIHGEKVSFSTPFDALKAGIGMVHQEFSLIPGFTATENILLNREPKKSNVVSEIFGDRLNTLDYKQMNERSAEAIKKMGVHIDQHMVISDMPVGHKQFTEIARELSKDNLKLLILDEPTAVLTPQEIDELMKIMKNLAKEGKSILFITHKLNEIMEVADRCTILRKGKYIGTVNISETSKEELSRMMVGRNVSFSVNKKPSKPGDTVLKVEHMTVPSKVHGNNAVKDVSFNVRKGEIVCIAGIDGNGQSEFVQGLTGLEKVSGGKILFNGQDITKASIRDRSKMGMSHIPEDRHKHGLVLDYSIEQNMVLQRYWQPEFESFGFIKSKAVREYAERLIEQYDVRSGQGPVTITRSMSGGNQQKAIIAREIDKDPDLLVAVQPTRGLDVGAIEYIHSQLVAQRDKGKAVLLVSLELDEVMDVSDRILVMYEGELVGQLDPKTVSVEELGLYMAGAKRDPVPEEV